MSIDISNYRKLARAKEVEDILCYATLVAHGVNVENVRDADDYYKSLKNEDCQYCPFIEKCAAVEVNA